LGLVGGLLLVVFAGALAPPAQVIEHPLESSYPQALAAAR
jgi:hypothetical protein